MKNRNGAPPFPVEPPRLIHSDGAAGALLREALPGYARPLPRAVAQPRRRFPWAVVVVAGTCALALLIVRRPQRSENVAVNPALRNATAPIILPLGSAPAPEPTAPERRAPIARGLRATPRPLALAMGDSALADGTVIRLGPASAGSLAAPTPHLTTLSLVRGTVALAVAKRRLGEHLDVVAGPYQFRVVGTRFRVTLAGGEARLEVSEGIVAVRTKGRELRRVGAGGVWQGTAGMVAEVTPEEHPPIEEGPPAVQPSAPPEPAPAPAVTSWGPPPPSLGEPPRPREDGPTAPAAPLPKPSECARLASAEGAQPAVGCYARLASGRGLDAELALIQIARLDRDALHDPRAALTALEDYRRRFPRGTLREEALTALVDLYARTGDAERALAESERLLGAASPERRGELHLLRGNVLRTQEHDCRRAAAEYADAETSARAPLADEAAFARAQCLSETGEREAARSAFARYLARPAPRHGAEARRALEGLAP
jgi:hypothetical protein